MNIKQIFTITYSTCIVTGKYAFNIVHSILLLLIFFPVWIIHDLIEEIVKHHKKGK